MASFCVNRGEEASFFAIPYLLLILIPHKFLIINFQSTIFNILPIPASGFH